MRNERDRHLLDSGNGDSGITVTVHSLWTRVPKSQFFRLKGGGLRLRLTRPTNLNGTPRFQPPFRIVDIHLKCYCKYLTTVIEIRYHRRWFASPCRQRRSLRGSSHDQGRIALVRFAAAFFIADGANAAPPSNACKGGAACAGSTRPTSITSAQAPVPLDACLAQGESQNAVDTFPGTSSSPSTGRPRRPACPTPTGRSSTSSSSIRDRSFGRRRCCRTTSSSPPDRARRRGAMANRSRRCLPNSRSICCTRRSWRRRRKASITLRASSPRRPMSQPLAAW